jgi:antibiotic biosynthesis monooxygenase (ABM) superfamily enzyme
MDPRPSVAFIITHTIKAGEEARYEAWLPEMLSAVSRAPGYLGREVFRPAPGRRTYTSILRFDTDDHLVVLKFSVVSTPLKFLRLVVYWTAR